MSGRTGNQCAIYEKIDALDEARTVAELVARLKPILSELAYFAVTGEASVMEAREEWHAQYTDELYSVTAADHSAAAARQKAERPAARQKNVPDPAPRGEKKQGKRHQAPPPSNRPRPSDIPASLLAIMNGKHPSFKDDD